MDDYALLLENPRRRRRRRHRRYGRRRRRNPFEYGLNPRRRRRRRHRRGLFGRRRRGFRRNPGLLSGLGSTAGQVGNVLLADFAGDALTRGVQKIGAGKLLQDSLKLTPEAAYGVSRIALGFLGPMAFRMVGIRGGFNRWFRLINIAAGIAGLTMGVRQKALSSVGLAGLEDYRPGAAWREGYRYPGEMGAEDDLLEDEEGETVAEEGYGGGLLYG